MDAHAAIRRLDIPSGSFPLGPQLARIVVHSLLALLALAGVLICVRRISGALSEPLPTAVFLSVGGLLSLSAVVFRAAFPLANWRGSRMALYANRGVPSVVLALWAVGLSLHETSSGGLFGLWGLLVAEETWSWGRLWQYESAPKEPNGVAERPSLAASQSDRSRAGAMVLGEEDEDIEDISQQVVRRRQPDGSETIEGWVRSEFLQGQRNGAAHIAICPPLDRVPQCFAEQMDGPAAQIKIGQVLPYGARFEIKLDTPAERATSVIVEFSIHGPAAAD
jgi:hypothetical protein